MKKITLIVGFLFVSVLTFGQTVNIGGTSYGSIAAAITASSNGDVIDITGSHAENLSWNNKNITIRGNDATTAIIDGGAAGAVITMFGGTAQTVTFENLTLRNGSITGRGGAIYYDIGGAGTAGTITLNNVIVENNTATTEGGGIAMLGGNLTINNSIIRNNTSTTDGGGLVLTTKGTAMEMNINNSLIQGNSGRNGGGIYVNGNANNINIDLNLENTTLTGNTTTSASGGAGGGAVWIKAFNGASNVDLKLVHVTTYNNSHAAAAKNGFTFTGGTTAFTNVSVYNSILVNADDITQKNIKWTRTNVVDIVNSIVGGSDDAGNTTYGNSANTFLDDGAKNNQKGKTATQAGLTGTLTDKGGFSNVIPITENSAADDFCSVATGITIPTTDQRGYVRSGNNDAGAYEYYDNTWIGSSSTDWATAGNWTDGVPGNDDILIPDVTNAPIIGSSTNVSVNDIVISEADGLNIASGGTLIVNGTFSGNVTYNRELNFVSGNANGWHLIASPVAGQTYNNAFANANSLATSGTKRGLAFYNDALASGSKYTYLLSDDSNTSNFNSGVYSGSGIGYSAKRESTGTVAFTGTINTDNVNGVSISTSGNGFNLLGNPYTSYISSQTFLNDNSNLDQTQIWVWKQDNTSGGNFISMTAKADNFTLAPGQGFFVKATSGSTVNFAETNQTNTGNAFQKSSKTEVKLIMDDGNTIRFAKMYYLNNVTKAFDAGYEGETFGGIINKLDVFTHIVEGSVGKNYQVQSLPISEIENTVVPVGIRAADGKEITFTAQALNLPTGIKIFLEDRVANTFTRLDEVNTEYIVTLNTSLDGIGRFYLHTSSSALSINENITENISIYTTSATNLRMVGLTQGNTNIKMYNILGKQVLNQKFKINGVSDITLPKLTSGVYIIQLETENGKLNKKIIIE